MREVRTVTRFYGLIFAKFNHTQQTVAIFCHVCKVRAVNLAKICQIDKYKEFFVHSFVLNTNKLQNYLQIKSSELYSSMFYFLLAGKRKLIELFMVLMHIYLCIRI